MDEMISKKKFNPGDKFILEIGKKRMALDEYEIVGTDLWVWGSLLEKLTPYNPDHNAEVSKKVGDDLISRQAAKLKVARVMWKDGDSYDDFQDKCVDCLDDVPSAQPVLTCKGCKYDYYEYAGCRNCLRRERDLYEPE